MTTDRATHHPGKWLLALMLASFIAASATYLHAGYYNGPLFRDIPAANAGAARPAIVMLSGDMGNRTGMTPKIAARLHARGYAIVTVNSLTYFSPRRTAQDAAQLIRTAMARAMKLGKTGRVVLIGQSFGADMLHAGLAQLSADARRPIKAVVLVVPGEDIIFHASPIELAGLEIPDQRAWPTASRLNWIPVTCIHGADEADSLCPELRMPNVRRITLPGGHRLKSDDRALEAAILPAIGGGQTARSE
ncbi:MAG TPA: AcvB/VirJ family lysyl-phosphatidylglycerol hydrolase [Sphingopyxis sp.]|uniref:AcvB/VirJ family lysyl-phosphatidylglycerol hydrolase n=1 Tax=Sphingopyxis sp. TaxID=1908224 RepID=UPI002C5C52A3|nr:AcvB/VirJ family lysyl-phosphatidylglycerol hydrolase [Sphingopyxis sp.]HWW57331.1 AcvB/VirJ family lysyl-phosphatidylglycerol hydrolase [Sphingopyxis sp.]